MPILNNDCPGMQVHPALRLLWISFGLLLLIAANANLAYLMTAPDMTGSPVAPVVENFTSHEAVSESDDGLANICTLTDVVCDGEFLGEIPVAVNPQRGKVLLDSPRPVSTVIKKNATPSMQEMVDYAWSISKNVDFILTIEAESRFNPRAVGRNSNGTRDHGIAQINDYWHRDIVKDPRFADWKWQLEKGWELYKSGTKFYGFDVRHKVRNRFVMK